MSPPPEWESWLQYSESGFLWSVGGSTSTSHLEDMADRASSTWTPEAMTVTSAGLASSCSSHLHWAELSIWEPAPWQLPGMESELVAGKEARRQGGKQARRQGGKEAGKEVGKVAGRQGGRQARWQADCQSRRQAKDINC